MRIITIKKEKWQNGITIIIFKEVVSFFAQQLIIFKSSVYTNIYKG